MEPFSVGLFVGAVEEESYAAVFSRRGYVTLSKCVGITREDLEEMGIDCEYSFRSDYSISGLGFRI